MSIKHTTTVDIGDLRTLSKPIHLMQYDKSLPEIEVHITKDGQEYTIPSGYSAMIRWGKPDKHGCTATGTVSGSTVTFQVTEQMACVAGRSKVTVEIVESDSSHAGTAKFEVIVDSNPIGDNTIVSDSEIADIQKAIEAGQNADKALETANQAQSIIDDVTEKAESASTLINNATESLESSVETARGYAESAITSASNASASAKSASDTVSGFDTHVAEKETELDTYTSGKKTELDTYTNTKKKVIDEYLDQVGADIMSAKDTAVTASQTAAAKANEASTSATTASQKAEEASTSAQTAAAKANEAKDSADIAQDAAQTATAPTLGKVLEALYAQQRTGKIYGVKIPAYVNSTTSTCVKTDDNTDIAIPTPATDTVEGSDEYLNIPLFQWMNCNYIREDDATPIVTALEGSSNYMAEGAVDVGVIGMTYYEDWKVLDDGTIYYRRSDKKNVPAGIVTPCKQAVRQDGSVMPYFIFPKYYSGIASDGFLRSNYGLKPARNQSYNSMMTDYQKKGTGYHGGSVMRQTFGILNMALKYATKNSQKYFAGVTGYAFQYALAEKSEEERTYVVVTEQHANDILVGGCVSVGYDGTTSSNKDRGNPTIHAYADDVRVLSKEVQEDGNYRIYLDCNPFVTTLPSGADESKVNVYITSMHAHAGWTDEVKGNYDGSPISNTDGKHPFRLCGLEYSVGGYEVVSDVVMNTNSGYTTDVYRCERWATRKTALSDIQDNYTKVGTIPVNGADNSDFWIGDYGITDGCWYPSSIGSSDSLGVGDMTFRGGANTGLREFLMGGYLWDGSTAGFCCLSCWNGLGYARWHCLSAD